jgi:hypothetical protein
VILEECLRWRCRQQQPHGTSSSPYPSQHGRGLLASLLRATVLQWARIAVAKFQGISSFTGLSAATWFVVVRNVTTEAVQLLLSEQTALWVLYIIAPRTFDVSFKLKVEMLRATASRAILYSKATIKPVSPHEWWISAPLCHSATMLSNKKATILPPFLNF